MGSLDYGYAAYIFKEADHGVWGSDMNNLLPYSPLSTLRICYFSEVASCFVGR
ncbi:hypothetical protein [Corynebacterium poyangense]|uniref:hypothetical protein n=1 Tax=Corynebacterium poyangense TaxID=2684405 RepID=UPI001CC94EBA|nr:hypothetical protein [Corynebacterium poyangense]